MATEPTLKTPTENVSGASALFGGGTCDIPPDVATCPECGSKMYAECVEWDMETGTPTTTGIMVNCVADDEEMEHRYWQSDWQPIIDAVNEWAGAVD